MKNLIVISAPSGAGKTTICRELQKRRPDLEFSVSCTTRPKRSYEIEGVDYEFIDEKEFQRRVVDNELVEHEEVHGFLYGTPRKVVEKVIAEDRLLLLEVDVKGGLSIKNSYPKNTLAIFIKPPSVEELQRRLRRRGSEPEERIVKRLERMELEMLYEPKYDITVVNEDLDATVTSVMNSIELTNQVEEETWD
ncbi:MAG: guanylate kinase [Fidelibacterota bacterium]